MRKTLAIIVAVAIASTVIAGLAVGVSASEPGETTADGQDEITVTATPESTAEQEQGTTATAKPEVSSTEASTATVGPATTTVASRPAGEGGCGGSALLVQTLALVCGTAAVFVIKRK